MWYLLIFLLLIIGFVYLFQKYLKLDQKRKLSEKFFIILTATTAFVIIAFVIYLLVHIIVLGKDQMSWSFIFESPKEGLTEGGIFPAIIGTALLVIIMSIIGVPIGTITAIYLTEYAKQNSIISKIIRFAVNTLAGVPAIVFGLFGLGFFIGVVGKQMDVVEQNRRMDKMEVIFNASNSPFLDDGKANVSEIKKLLRKNDSEYWTDQIELTQIMNEMYAGEPIEKKTVLDFYKERTRPHWGQPALIWAAFTMALLTLPVVIVSVEEAIKTVPMELREASLALGATKFKTILKVVLPGSITGILTGAILAVSRGAGEVAPILFTGAAYFLPDLPNSLSSQFMELGYHIYVLTTQSTNVELTKPLQYATTLVLLILTFALNFSAIFLRSKIRSKMSKNS
jgi:ABC-type phosphate transport system permease subunit